MPTFKEEQKDPTSQYNPTQEEQETISHIKATYESYKEQTDKLRDDWKEIYEVWKLHLDDSEYPWRSKLVIPVLFWSIETLAPKLLSSSPTLNAKAVGEEDELKADFVAKFLDFQWRNTMDMRRRLNAMVKSMLAYGVGIAKIYWKTDTINIENTKTTKGKQKKVKKEKKVIYDDPMFEVKSLFDVYLDPKVSDLQDSEYVIDYFEKSKKELTAQKDIYKNLDKVVGTTDTSLNSDNLTTSRSVDFVDLASSQGGPEKVRCIEAWSRDRVVTLADIDAAPVIIRDIPNPYQHGRKPFISMHCYDSPEFSRFYTQGIGSVLKDLQTGINTTANQTIDNINLIINKMYKIRRGSNLDRKQLISRPGGFIEVDDLREDLEELKTTNISSSAQFLMEQFMGWAQNTSGATDLLRGMGGTSTATGLSIEDKNANSRMSILQGNVEDAINKAGKMILSLDQQYIQNTRTIRIFDEDIREDVFIKFGEKELDGEFDIEINSDSTVQTSKEVMNKQLLDGIQIFGNDPSFGLKKSNASKLWFKNAGFTDLNEIVKTDNELKDESRAAEQAESQAQAGPPEDKRAIQIATEENERLAAGERVPPYPQPTPDHVQVHMPLQELPNASEHIQAEMDIIEGGGVPTQGQGPPPQEGQGQAPPAPDTGAGLTMEDQVRSAFAPVTQR